MQGPRAKFKPEPAVEVSHSDEASKLTTYLQKQLEEDIARIFDESIYPDIELGCGKLKILSHVCILKTRSNNFYRKLETILHVNIDRSTFDEIYSFISDSYTECDIKRQEKEILTFLKSNGYGDWPISKSSEEAELYSTPKCLTPYSERSTQKSICSSPSIELTKEYYALVPIEGNILEKELIEQEVLSNAFHSIIKSQNDILKSKVTRVIKPTSLSLSSSHTTTITHSSNCDIVPSDDVNGFKTNTEIGKSFVENNTVEKLNLISDIPDLIRKTTCDRHFDSTYSPDSLITDEASSASDYLSAAYASPGFVNSGIVIQSNVANVTSKMENHFHSSDSGLEQTGLQESLNSNRNGTLIDVSLTESQSTFTETHCSSLTQSSENVEPRHNKITNADNTNEPAEIESQADRKLLTKYKSSKEEKQRQNEEIVILESSSLSSETGSWESVFPPKIVNKETTIHHDETRTEEPQQFSGNSSENIMETLVTRSPFKSTSCFIDAASLADEEESERIQAETNGIAIPIDHSTQLVQLPLTQPPATQPLPCSTVKLDLSPNDKSESNENDDSLEQGDKDLSPTIFQMTPIAEDSLSSNIIDSAFKDEIPKDTEPLKNGASTAHYTVTTPYNSIMSLKSPSLKQYESEIESDTSKETQPIVSGGASVEDHLPSIGNYTCSPSARRKLENAPIISGAFAPEIENKSKSTKSPRSSSVSSWIVDMSAGKMDVVKNCSNVKRPGDKICETLKRETLSSSSENCCKSRSSVDSDSSERSSQKFYIDLSSLSDQSLPDKNSEHENNAEKKNIFSMFIDLGETSKVKEMPARLSSSLNSKKLIHTENKSPKIDSAKSSVKKAPKENTKVQLQDAFVTTFEALETLCNDPNLSISEIVKIPVQPINTISSGNNLELQTKPDNLRAFPQETDKKLNSEKKVIPEESLDELSEDLFVKLSDLDKPTLKSETSLSMIKSNIDVPMIRSTPNSNWQETAQKNTSRSIDIISSFHSENTLTINRLFPNLKNELSVSVPSTLSGRTRSPSRLIANHSGNIEERASDVSEISSVQSSYCRSGIENSTTEDTSQTSSLISNCQSRLGQDLLRMFLEEIAPDVIVEVSGRRIKAHKCILSSRCQYFAGILSGGWVESSGNVIVLPPFSFNVVHFALCHIYSGVSTIPDSISIVELATIADMLGLEGLKEVIMFTLKAKYCHHFHKPCQVCTAGVLECFPLSSVYGLDDLYRKCLRWITRHFFKVWPTKAFATLPKELLDKCYQELVVNLNVENLVDTVYGCGVTVASLQNSRWADSVGRMCRRLLNAAAHFAAARLVSVLKALGGGDMAGAAARQALDDCVAAAIEWAPPDEACRAYAFLSEVAARPDLLASGECLLLSRASAWRVQCEGALVRAAPRVVASQAFKDLPPDLRKRLRELGCIMYGTHALPPVCSPLQDRKTRSAYHPAPPKNNTSTRSLDIDHVRTSFVPYVPRPVIETMKHFSDDKPAKKVAKPPKIRMTKAQEERARYNLTKTNLSQDRIVKVSQKPKLENARSRYLEPKVVRDTEEVQAKSNKHVHKMISSSESSRNSPIQPRSNRIRNKQGDKLKPQAMSQDSLATSSRPWTAEPSTDSLSESQTSNKYATYTKAKNISKGSVESVKTTSKTQTSSRSAANNKTKTRIPVYYNQAKVGIGRSRLEANKNTGSSKNLAQNGASVVPPSRGKHVDNKVPASLMCATKSSSAKIVTKVVKEAQKNKNVVNKQKISKRQDVTPPTEIPIMGRSGTFLKDEPTFGDKTINIDQ